MPFPTCKNDKLGMQLPCIKNTKLISSQNQIIPSGNQPFPVASGFEPGNPTDIIDVSHSLRPKEECPKSEQPQSLCSRHCFHFNRVHTEAKTAIWQTVSPDWTVMTSRNASN